MNNLEIGDKVFPFVKLAVGGVWVDEEAKIKPNTNTFIEGFNGDWFYNTIYKQIARIGDITDYDFKIIARTPDCDIPNVPVVEVGDSLLDQIDSLLRLLEDTAHGSEGRDITAMRSKIQEAQSKGVYSEAQVRLIFNEGFALGNAQIEESDGNEEFYDSDFKRILASIQPKIVVGTQDVMVGRYSEDGMPIYEKQPITFKGEDGRTHFKINLI